MEENLYKDIFNSQNNTVNSFRENLESVKDKDEYIDYFYKVEKLDKNLREELYRSYLELVKNLESFIPEDKDIWKNEKLAHKYLFKSPKEVFDKFIKEEKFIELVRSFYNQDEILEKILLEEIKIEYLKYIRKYLILISSRGYKNIYKNYVEILEKSNEIREEIMTPLSEILDIKDFNFELESKLNFIKRENKFFKAKEKLENIDFNSFYEDSINSQNKILNDIKNLSEILIDYYNLILKEILNSLQLGKLYILKNSNSIEIINFKDYYLSIINKTFIIFEINIDRDEYNNILKRSIEEICLFN